jgi:hypothetical protein
MLTTPAVEKRLRLLFANSVVRFGKLKRPTLACTTMEAGKHVITLPDGHDDFYTLRVLFHELIHLALPGELAAFGTWEESIIERVAEPELMHWITGRPRVQAWWLKQLSALREG